MTIALIQLLALVKSIAWKWIMKPGTLGVRHSPKPNWKTSQKA